MVWLLEMLLITSMIVVCTQYFRKLVQLLWTWTKHPSLKNLTTMSSLLQESIFLNLQTTKFPVVTGYAKPNPQTFSHTA